MSVPPELRKLGAQPPNKQAKFGNPAGSCDMSCKYWTHDMDGAFCTHPKSFEIAPTWGASTNRMSVEGHCQTNKHGNNPAVPYALWEPR